MASGVLVSKLSRLFALLKEQRKIAESEVEEERSMVGFLQKTVDGLVMCSTAGFCMRRRSRVNESPPRLIRQEKSLSKELTARDLDKSVTRMALFGRGKRADWSHSPTGGNVVTVTQSQCDPPPRTDRKESPFSGIGKSFFRTSIPFLFPENINQKAKKAEEEHSGEYTMRVEDDSFDRRPPKKNPNIQRKSLFVSPRDVHHLPKRVSRVPCNHRQDIQSFNPDPSTGGSSTNNIYFKRSPNLHLSANIDIPLPPSKHEPSPVGAESALQKLISKMGLLKDPSFHPPPNPPRKPAVPTLTSFQSDHRLINKNSNDLFNAKKSSPHDERGRDGRRGEFTGR